ncbi:MAG: mechanosensitive ion channel family protein [Anaerolineaceae bacterium]|nr:mechanosensitive ion channel family protein [Anaerolineaceae bacterium]
MKNRKTFIAFGLLLLLLVIFMGITLYTNILSFMEVSSQADLKVSGMVNTLTRVQEQINSQESEYRTKTENMMELMCLALRPYVKENTYNGPELFIDESNERSNDGIVVRIEDNGNVIYPEGFSGRFELQNESDQVDRMPVMSSAALINEDGSSVSVLVSAKKIEGNFYYLDWWKTENYRSFVNYEKTIGEAIAALEKLYDAKLLLVWQPQEESQNNETEILYVSEELGTPESFKDLGITQEDILLETAKLTIGKKIYTATYEQLMIFDRPAKAVVLLNPVSNNIYILNCIVIASGFMLLCIGGLILWLHWIKDYSRDHELTENQMRSWRLSQLRKRAFAVGLNGALLLFLLLLAYQLMGNLSRTSQSNQESLDIMMARLEDSSKRVASAKQDAEEWGIYYAGRIADLYSRVPETHSPEFLKKANELIGSESIMIFDSKGKELLSSNGYVGFTLGDGVNTEKDFTYLLNGIAHIVHEPKMDQFTGKTLQTIGVKMDVGDPASYGAVIVAIDPEITWESTERQEIANYVRMLTHQESLSFIIREASGKVAYTSDSELLEKTPDEIDLDLETLQPVSLETFMIMAKKWYGAYNRDEQFHYFFMTNADSIWGDSLKFALFSAVYFMLVCQLISLYVLGTSREDFIEFTKDAEQLKDKLKQKSGITIDTEALDAFRYEERGDRSLKEWWHDMTPDQRIGLVMKLSITLLLVILFIILSYMNEFGTRSVFNFILYGGWKRELNELSVTAILIVLAALLTFILFKDLLVRVLSSVLNAKGKTIVGLISSLLQYISIITAIFVSLSYLGFDSSVLITSASILTLAVSLGSKDLVADILSGIFIIFEGDFHVGDTIDVNGFKGRVLDIGVRSTKLIDAGRNIKTIENQNVKNVLNLSKENSTAAITLTVSTTEPFEEIEAMLNRELPKIGERIPTIINGPFYGGIAEIGYHRLAIKVTAECRQKDQYKTQTRLNRELWELFTKNGYRL